MSNEFKGFAAHSAEHFGEARDHWWSEDYLRFITASWPVAGIRSVLDVGCGVGHWGRMLARVLPPETLLVGVDREPLWIQHATERAQAAGLSARLTYQTGTAEQLPFPDGCFDLVTCQTLLIHLREPARGLAEMIRVTRPGGLVVAAEPTNLLGPALLDALALGESPETISKVIAFQLKCQGGKARLGEGDDLLGEKVPALFAAAGLSDIEVRLNNRTHTMLPPYRSVREQAAVRELIDYSERGIWMWNEVKARRYFVAGGGNEDAFAPNWAFILALQQRVLKAMDEGRFTLAGGGLFYLVWGRKPPGD